MGCKKHVALVFGGVVLLFSNLLLAQGPFIGHPADRHVGPDYLYPDASITPGKADTVSVEDLTDSYECPTSIAKQNCTYSQAHRNVSSSKRRNVYDAYKVPADRRNRKSGEIDHFDPLCLGGSNDFENLWYQPANNNWNGRNYGYHEKDDLESWACRQVKAGKLDPKEAFEKITSDWVKYYMEVNPKHVKFSD